MAKKYYYEGLEILTPLTISSNEPHFDMTTVSLKTQRASQDHQRWELSFNVLSTEDDAANLFLSTMVNFDVASTMIMPQLVKEAGANTLFGTITVAANATAGSSSVSINNSQNETGILPKGSFVKFEHSKVYITTTTLNLSNSSTSQTVGIYPNLITAVSGGDAFKTGDDCVLSYFKSIDNQMGITYQDGILSNIGTISLIEAL